ncbi:uncharacterized protein G2W53_010053 [Senna tora]|uniref:Uncharacterized protein n=1 Tax=Senna tora TaxID=362788 RepID=A0A834WZ85_9FABA|nr:uncharacterized protein G2W53_010053 [Senna tora]
MAWHTTHAIMSPIRALNPLRFTIQRGGVCLTHLDDKTLELLHLGFL